MTSLANFDWKRWRLVILGGLIVGTILFAAIFARWIAPLSPYDLDVVKMLHAPSPDHWL